MVYRSDQLRKVYRINCNRNTQSQCLSISRLTELTIYSLAKLKIGITYEFHI